MAMETEYSGIRHLEVDSLAVGQIRLHLERIFQGIFAARAAPVQAAHIGYPGTMGAPYIDYILADPTVLPEADIVHYAEKIVWLPDTYQPNDRSRAIATDTPSRSEAGLPSFPTRPITGTGREACNRAISIIPG